MLCYIQFVYSIAATMHLFQVNAYRQPAPYLTAGGVLDCFSFGREAPEAARHGQCLFDLSRRSPTGLISAMSGSLQETDQIVRSAVFGEFRNVRIQCRLGDPGQTADLGDGVRT